VRGLSSSLKEKAECMFKDDPITIRIGWVYDYVMDKIPATVRAPVSTLLISDIFIGDRLGLVVF